MNPLNKIKPGVRWLFNSKLRAGIVIVLLLLLGFAAYKTLGNKTAAPQYQTTQAQKGTLITTVTASGTITAGNTVDISTNATGIVSSVEVKNGDTVSQGDKIAEITLDLSSQQKQAAAWSSYLSSKTALDAAQSKINSLQAAEFKANQAFINDAVARNLVTADPNYVQENASWKRSEEHTSELQSPDHLVCRLLLEKKNLNDQDSDSATVPDATQAEHTAACPVEATLHQCTIHGKRPIVTRFAFGGLACRWPQPGR